MTCSAKTFFYAASAIKLHSIVWNVLKIYFFYSSHSSLWLRICSSYFFCNMTLFSCLNLTWTFLSSLNYSTPNSIFDLSFLRIFSASSSYAYLNEWIFISTSLSISFRIFSFRFLFSSSSLFSLSTSFRDFYSASYLILFLILPYSISFCFSYSSFTWFSSFSFISSASFSYL